ncbi:hypothetical protein ScPMuIL_016665 [Solemya velum]
MSSGSDYDSPIRNPSPPPELRQNLELLSADSIGNTAFSKHWLFSTLMKLIEEVEKENDDSEKEDMEPVFAVDVDDELQNELCRLWDMSMNSDVAVFLQEYKAVDIMVGVIGKSKAPRVTEICIGILGNMACNESICKSISENEKLIRLTLLLLESTDAPTLVETTRLLYTSLSCRDAKLPWITAIDSSNSVQGHLQFIFQSSTNCDLLKNTAELVDILFDLRDNFSVTWATTDFIQALLEAIQQIGCSHSDALEIFLHIFQVFSTTEKGVESLVTCAPELKNPLLKYLNIICEDEIVGLEGREACLASALSVLHVLFNSTNIVSEQLTKDEQIMRIFLKILEPLYPILQDLNESFDRRTETSSNSDKNVSENDKNSTETDKNVSANGINSSLDTSVRTRTAIERYELIEKEELTLLLTFVRSFVSDFLFKFVGESDSASDTKLDIGPLLRYLDSSSSRRRLNYFLLTIKATASDKFDPVKFLKASAIEHKAERLERIIDDVVSGRYLERADSHICPESHD